MSSQRSIKPVLKAVFRGLACRCPNCGVGSIYDSYLKPASACKTCGEPFGHIRTDDFAPWLTIFLISHIAFPSIYFIEQHYAPSMLMQILIYTPFVLGLVLILLPHTKGVCLGLMWALRLKGDEQHNNGRPCAASHPGQD